MPATALAPEAVVGRRITYTHPITGAALDGSILLIEEGTLIRFRLDGHRMRITAQASSEYVQYLPQVAAIPPMPVGRFHPIPDELAGVYAMVPVANVGDLLLLTDDVEAAGAAVQAYYTANSWDPSTADLSTLVQRWVAFEWPEDTSVLSWSWSYPADDDHDGALQMYVLPAPASEE
ncbi:hypothetical protein [Streptomyces longwoodensis]|uniref:hypothetical protein n=1 Tax=Streptomyces longwoodensis TaxID=68231 RepID=UPI0022595D62|nr:hypothetical protein [Streptomyces longwoodensis]MCX5000918.1 hypothetical protein [Streptomyces longwoodensis]